MILHKRIRKYVLEIHVPTSTLGEYVSFHVLFNILTVSDPNYFNTDDFQQYRQLFKVSGPCVETSSVFFCITNNVNDEIWAWKTTLIT